jgi:transmembrane sensor
MRDLDRQIENLRAQQASAWVSALMQPDTGQHAQFVAWLKESPLNVREFLLAYSIEQSLSQLDPQRRCDVDALLARIKPEVTSLPMAAALSQSESIPTRASQPASLSRRGLLYRMAAGLAAVGLISWVWLEQQSDWQQFATGTGEQRALQLEDGSLVHLNARSTIALKFSATARDIKLIEGEALFEVHHDEQRPFRVFTRDAVIRDIGTRFNVHSRSDGVKVAVIEGSVELTASVSAVSSSATTASKAAGAPESHVLMVAQQAQVNRDGKVTLETLPDVSEASAWWQRRLVYRKETLAHIVEDFNRYNQRRIHLEGDAVMQRTYTGVFDADDPDSLAQVLASDPELVVERMADDIIVVRAR